MYGTHCTHSPLPMVNAHPSRGEGEDAVACKDAEPTDLSTDVEDAKEGEDAEEEAKEMLDIDALD